MTPCKLVNDIYDEYQDCFDKASDLQVQNMMIDIMAQKVCDLMDLNEEMRSMIEYQRKRMTKKEKVWE